MKWGLSGDPHQDDDYGSMGCGGRGKGEKFMSTSFDEREKKNLM